MGWAGYRVRQSEDSPSSSKTSVGRLSCAQAIAVKRLVSISLRDLSIASGLGSVILSNKYTGFLFIHISAWQIGDMPTFWLQRRAQSAFVVVSFSTMILVIAILWGGCGGVRGVG